jgi:nitroreductase
MDLFEAIQKRRSVRSLVETDIPREHLEKIVDAGRMAPSGTNAQPREFIIITDPEIINKLSTVQGFLRNASAIIAIVADDKGSKYWLEDVSASAENMLLAIVALGYDSCWVEGTLLRKEDEAKRILGVPESKRLMVLLPVGKAAVPGNQASKKPMTEITYYNRYGVARD